LIDQTSLSVGVLDLVWVSPAGSCGYDTIHAQKREKGEPGVQQVEVPGHLLHIIWWHSVLW
jgi:hypothetical protein